MKLSNETKVGALTAIAIAMLILGFNFLKGRSVFKTGTFLYAKYNDTKKLLPSHPVFINGFQIGTVYEIESVESKINEFVVAVKLNGTYEIPDNSVAVIEPSALSTPSMVINPGNSSVFLNSGDTLPTGAASDLLGQLSSKISPVADSLQQTLASLNEVLKNVNSTLNPATKGNLQSTIANLNKVSESIIVSAASLQQMLNQQSGALAKSLDNVKSVTGNLAANNDKINAMMSNIEATTGNLAKADIDGAVNNLKDAVEKLNGVMNKINSSEGTLGSLINDKEMYNNLNGTVRSMNILLDDLRAHPKRYVNISVFGRKDKGDYLTQPLDTTAIVEKK